jgi:hypothetical protein
LPTIVETNEIDCLELIAEKSLRPLATEEVFVEGEFYEIHLHWHV